MRLRDTSEGYGLVSRLFHWLMAVAIFAMFALGWWMVRLDYYSPYYVSGPDLHRSVGMVLLFALLLRWGWRLSNPKPSDDELSPIEKKLSFGVHWGFYVLLLILLVSGYFISTPDGAPIDVFGLFKVPSLVQEKGIATTAGKIHRVLAYTAIALAILHTLAALKHHFVDRSDVLKRMWRGAPRD